MVEIAGSLVSGWKIFSPFWIALILLHGSPYFPNICAMPENSRADFMPVTGIGGRGPGGGIAAQITVAVLLDSFVSARLEKDNEKKVMVAQRMAVSQWIA